MLNFGLFDRLYARRRTIMFVVAAAFGLLALSSNAGFGFDSYLRQVREQLRAHPASGEVHIVEIDARSLAKIERWPWPRSYHAKAIDRLREAEARTIAFDVDFSARSSPEEDALLAAALDRAGGAVVLPTFRQNAGAGQLGFIDSIPAEPFVGKAFLAAVTILPDRDGYVRQFPLGMETAGVARPSLASMVAERAAETDRYFPVDFSIDPASIPRHSFIDLVEGRIPKSALKGKRVLVGATAVELGDRYAVPGHGVMPGVVIQAIAAETLLDGPVPVAAGGLAPLGLAFIIVALCARPGLRRRRITLFAAGTMLIFLLPLVTEAVFAFTFEIAPALIALAVAALVAGGAYAGAKQRARALTDPITGLSNRVALVGDADAIGARMVVVARIDRFAAIAAGLGAEATARLVQRVAERLGVANERVIYRIEDASLAWIEGPEETTTMEERLEAVVAVMRSPIDCGRLVDVTLSLGIADDGDSGVEQLAANAALAAVNAARKGLRWERFSNDDREEADWHLSLLSELDAAMLSGQMWNAYQPKLDIATGNIVGAEALVRWLHPKRGPIAPDNFIPLVEEHGRIRDLTSHVFARALEDAASWDRSGRPIGIAVNVSAALLGDEAFVEQMRQMLRYSPIPPERVTIEVTESAAMLNPDKAIAALSSWRGLGVNISIDDYGTGQSSLGYLQKLPATELKIDRSFVETITDDERNAIMVRSTIALAHELGMTVVAEGIESAACLKALAKMGCDLGQGFYIGRPMSASNLSVFLGGNHREAA